MLLMKGSRPFLLSCFPNDQKTMNTPKPVTHCFYCLISMMDAGEPVEFQLPVCECRLHRIDRKVSAAVVIGCAWVAWVTIVVCVLLWVFGWRPAGQHSRENLSARRLALSDVRPGRAGGFLNLSLPSAPVPLSSAVLSEPLELLLNAAARDCGSVVAGDRFDGGGSFSGTGEPRMARMGTD